ncbi:MAG: hypothetical protein NTZ05_01195, partial [Chloroflexi bacterium]|nr:hypothetical protein [Chloroflexota bacterium]
LTVGWSKTGLGGSFGTATSQTNAQGVATVQFTVATLAGTVHTVIATDNSVPTPFAGKSAAVTVTDDASPTAFTGTSAPLVVVPAAPAKYLVSFLPTNPTAGLPVSVTAQLADAFNNLVALAGRTVTWSAVPLNGSFAPTQSVTTAQGVAVAQFTSSTTPGVTYSLTATDTSSVTGGSVPFTTQAPVLLRLETQPGAAALNGNAVEVRIYADAGGHTVDRVQVRLTYDPAALQAVDADGQGANGVNLQPGTVFANVTQNVINTGTGSVSFAATLAAGQSPGTGTLLLGTMWVRGLAVGRQPVSFAAGNETANGAAVLGTLTQNGAVDVRAKGLRFVQQPIRGAHGVSLGMQPVVAVTDSSGSVVTGDSSTVVTLRIGGDTGAAGAALSCAGTAGGVTQANVANGLATFSGCAINLSGADYQLEATAAAPDLAGTRSGKFNVSWAGDTDGNCRVSIVDASLIVTYYGKSATDQGWTDPTLRIFRADLDGDGRVGVLDFSTVVSRFGANTTPCAPASQPAIV